MTVPVFTLTGTVRLFTGNRSTPVAGGRLTFTSNVWPGDRVILDDGSYLVGQVVVGLDGSGRINGGDGVELLANDESLGLSKPLLWTVAAINTGGQPISSWTFEAPEAGVTVDLKDVAPIVGTLR
jgi:hypothetical protein